MRLKLMKCNLFLNIIIVAVSETIIELEIMTFFLL